MVSCVGDTVQGHYQEDSLTKVLLEQYKDKAFTLNYFTLNQKEEDIWGLFLLKESLIFQNCVKKRSASKRQNDTLTLMYQSQRTREDILKWIVL